MYKVINEGEAKIKTPVGKISKKLSVFYNPVMEYNRAMSIQVLNSVEDKKMQIGLPLAGSGVRGVRFILELDKNKIENIGFNDKNDKAFKLMEENLKLNKIRKTRKILIKNQDANEFLLQSKGFDYIDIDPFGSPNPFLDSAIKRLARCGILAVTATDTGCLCGTYPRTCKRKYWAIPLRNEIMHEIGLRILIRKVQLIGAQYDRALTPIFSYAKDHYFRVFFRSKKGKKKVDEILRKHQMLEQSGPMWMGQLWDGKLVDKMSGDKFLEKIKEESKINAVGFYDIHALAKRYKLKIPKKEVLVKRIRKKGFKVSETHFSKTGLRSDIKLKELLKLF